MSTPYNGIATYELHIGRDKVVIKTARARITAKRVKVATCTWDHAGIRISKSHPCMMSKRLVSFQSDDGAIRGRTTKI